MSAMAIRARSGGFRVMAPEEVVVIAWRCSPLPSSEFILIELNTWRCFAGTCHDGDVTSVSRMPLETDKPVL